MSLPCVYVLVRRDLPLHQQLVQSCHAAFLSGLQSATGDEAHRLVLLEVEDENELLDRGCEMESSGIAYRMFFEPDDGMGNTAIATEPLERERTRTLSHLRLWRAP